MRILFVENHAVFARVVTGEFLADHKVVMIPSVEAATKLLERDVFDVALVDYDLDDGKGTEVVRHIRERGLGCVVVAVSAHDHGNQELLAAGADAMCAKTSFHRIGEVLGRVVSRGPR